MKASLLFLLALPVSVALAETAERFPERQSAKIIRTVDPVFPHELLATYHHGGQVSILISVSAEGRLLDWLPIRYSDPLFVEAAMSAVKEWKFEPARIRDEPVPVRIELNFSFEVQGVVVSIAPSDVVTAMFNDIIGGRIYGPCTLRDLDRIPVPLQTIPPVYPAQLAERGATGEVTVDFYIDEHGAVRMPSVAGNPQPMLANLAVDAVRQWKFEPPTRRSVPVLVHVRQVFHFTPAVAAKN